MKIQLKDLHPNPFRNFEHYSIDQIKVDHLINSISELGFWDNVLARKKKSGGFELAYGHHRLIALEQLFTPIHEIDIPVKKLDDCTMIKIMASENHEFWGTCPKILDETVRVTKKFLEEHPEFHPGVENSHWSKEAKKIASFLGNNWNERRVYHSLQRMGLIEEKVLDKEAVESMPTDKSAQRFTRAVKSIKNVSPEKQRLAAKRIKEIQDYSQSGIQGVLLDEKYKNKKAKPDKDLIRLNEFLAECSKDIGKLNLKIEALIELKKKVGSEIRVSRLEMMEFKNQAEMLIDNLSQLGSSSSQQKKAQSPEKQSKGPSRLGPGRKVPRGEKIQ